MAQPGATLAGVAAALDDPDHRARLHYVDELTHIVGMDDTLLSTLLDERAEGTESARGALVGYSTTDWTTALGVAHPDLTGPERADRAHALAARVSAAFPGPALIQAARTGHAAALHQPHLLAFFDSHPDVDVVTAQLAEIPALSADSGLRADVERIQRLAR